MTERTPESDTVSLSRSEYEALLERLEDAEDMLTLERAKQSQPGHTLPLAYGQRILDGEHPLRIWREHRGLTGQALAELSGVPQSYISAIERGIKSGSVRTLSRLAKALNVTLENIVRD